MASVSVYDTVRDFLAFQPRLQLGKLFLPSPCCGRLLQGPLAPRRSIEPSLHAMAACKRSSVISCVFQKVV